MPGAQGPRPVPPPSSCRLKRQQQHAPLEDGNVGGLRRDGDPHAGHELDDALDRNLRLPEEGREPGHESADLSARDVFHVRLVRRVVRNHVIGG